MWKENENCKTLDEKGKRVDCANVWKVKNGGRKESGEVYIKCKLPTCKNRYFSVDSEELKEPPYRQNEEHLILILYLHGQTIKQIQQLTSLPKRTIEKLFQKFNSNDIYLNEYIKTITASIGKVGFKRSFVISEKSPKSVNVSFTFLIEEK